MRIENLLLLCHPKGIDPTRQDVGGSYTRPEDRIQWGDVAWAFAQLKLHQRALILAKVDQQAVQLHECDYLISRLVGVIARAKAGITSTTHRKDSPKLKIGHRAHARYKRIAATVIMEYTDPKTCRQCNGRGKVQVYVEGRGVLDQSCPLCVGRGWVHWSPKRRAATCKVNQNLDHWNLNYAHAYEAAIAFCRGEYLAAVTKLKHALFGEPDRKTA